jgi:hypothetical protein
MIAHKKPLAELPIDADLTHRSWSYGFAHNSTTGVIRHCAEDGEITEYELPLAVCQLVVDVRAHAAESVRADIRRALGLQGQPVSY